MSVVTGHHGYVSRHTWDSVHEKPAPGWYVGPFQGPTPTLVECPYCYRLLLEVHPVDLLRIVQILNERGDQIEVVAERVPSTHRVLMCPTPCMQTFTILRLLDND